MAMTAHRPDLAQHPGAGDARTRSAKLATDVDTVQLTVSLYLLGLAVAQLVLGPLSDRFGRRPVVLAGLALTTVASLAAIFAVEHRRADRGARRAGARRLDRAS